MPWCHARPPSLRRRAISHNRTYRGPRSSHLPAVLTPRNAALELRVVEGVIFCVHGQVIYFRIDGKTFGKRPRHEYSAMFQAKIPVQRAGMVFLDYERIVSPGLSRRHLL